MTTADRRGSGTDHEAAAPRLSAVSRRLFRVALACCPRAFRDEHAGDLLQTLAERESELMGALTAGRVVRSRWRFRARESAAILRAAWHVRQRRPLFAGMPALEGDLVMAESTAPRASLFAGIGGDIRSGLRGLLKHPGHAVVSIATLAIAAGAATAVFSVLNAIVLTPLPYAKPEALVYIRDASLPRFPSFSVSPGRFLAWQQRTRAYDGIAATTGSSGNLTGAGDPERIDISRASANLFDVLGVPPLVGRGFTDADDRPGAAAVIILSEGLWMSHFARRADIIGQTITLNERPVTVIGVMPASFAYPARNTRAWVPLALSDDERRNYGSHFLALVGRVKAGVSFETARDDLARAARELEAEIPDGNRTWTTLVDPLHEFSIRNIRSGLNMLVAAAIGVLLIACANVAGLLLARGADRQREISVRAALGASRGRLIRQLLVESLTLGLAGALCGVGIAYLLLRALLASRWMNLPRITDVPLDGSALAFAAVLAAITPLVFGLLPALQLAGASLGAALGPGSRTGASSLKTRTRSVLIVGEVALAVMLVTGSALLLRSLDRLLGVAPGFQPDRLIAVGLSLPESRYGDAAKKTQFFSSVVERVRTLPGIEQVATTQSVPFLGDYVSSIDVEGLDVDPEARPTSNFYAISPGYFATMQIPVLRGRDFTDADRRDQPRVTIVSRQLAMKVFNTLDVVGKRIRISQGPSRDYGEIVGVVDDVRQYGLEESPTLQTYEPSQQHAYFGVLRLLIRTAQPTDTTVAAVRRAVAELDPLLPVSNATTMTQAIAATTGSRRFTTALLGGLALVALLLAAVGVYGLVSFSVGRRVQEFGVRMALGAEPRSIMRLVIGQGLRLALLGVAIGLVGALLTARLVQSLLFEVSATDPTAFLLATTVLVAAVIAACYSPARRAIRVNPVTALRGQ
ncbi:MAG TPA: ABC transporter permease [Vicinamibacterales bacterium]|nr:ABC transporter permease [Vicinamibacterales bacterium]